MAAIQRHFDVSGLGAAKVLVDFVVITKSRGFREDGTDYLSVQIATKDCQQDFVSLLGLADYAGSVWHTALLRAE
ncbi:hypothetical protein RN2511_035920 [Rhodococcus sp. NKCM2511]|uniref:hypothetical protein n=1 Tax=Rhodococcus sp. NKCM2511 TaxID=2766011 RepID=UPI001910BB5A|nr:hypothetical protein [Rhodococcus sp. NKCM2511]GHP18856.1 hypothetical protein RN2511_035920 [Rhodococcus sp. NKCM2511]